MMRPAMAVSALVLTLGVIQPGHGAALPAGQTVKVETRPVAGSHLIAAGERHRLRSGRGFRHDRHGRHAKRFRHGRRHRFRHGRRYRFGHGHGTFFLGLAIPFTHFVFDYHGHHHYYRGHGYGYGGVPWGGGSYRYLGRCRPVTKFGYDRFGRRAKIGGTMCFDRFGRAYVLSHSRYVIHYY